MKITTIGDNVNRLLEAIKERMKDGKKTQQEYADEMGITRKHLNRLLNGVARMSLEDALFLCALIDMNDKEVMSILYR